MNLSPDVTITIRVMQRQRKQDKDRTSTSFFCSINTSNIGDGIIRFNSGTEIFFFNEIATYCPNVTLKFCNTKKSKLSISNCYR